jgi:hypothetical protein
VMHMHMHSTLVGDHFFLCAPPRLHKWYFKHAIYHIMQNSDLDAVIVKRIAGVNFMLQDTRDSTLF